MTGRGWAPPSRPAQSWSTVAEAWQVIAYRPHLRRTALTALVVGTVLFLINHLDAVVTGTATAATWVQTAVTYLVPFTVANVGLLVGSHRRPDPGPHAHTPSRRRGSAERPADAAGRDAENAGYPGQRRQVVPVAPALLDALASQDRHTRQLSQLLQRQAAGQARYPQRRPGRVDVVQNDRVKAEGRRQPRHVPRLRCVRALLPAPNPVGRAHAGPLGEVFAG